ncbi:hypothetical protein HBB16_19815 [Pseudonocardia sp. MCCB 268]|nr:hypothetical protein [Pseudonocardia cytotoxica]
MGLELPPRSPRSTAIMYLLTGRPSPPGLPPGALLLRTARRKQPHAMDFSTG